MRGTWRDEILQMSLGDDNWVGLAYSRELFKYGSRGWRRRKSKIQNGEGFNLKYILCSGFEDGWGCVARDMGGL